MRPVVLIIRDGWGVNPRQDGNSAYAAKTPIFYTDDNGDLAAETKALLTGNEVKQVIIVGGTAVVTEAAESALTAAGKKVVRLAGDDRYKTSAAIARWALGQDTTAEFQPDKLLSVDKMGVATGRAYPDSLAAVDLLGRTGGLLLLVADRNVDQQAAFEANVAEFIAPNKKLMTAGYIFGGTSAVSEAIEAALSAAVAED